MLINANETDSGGIFQFRGPRQEFSKIDVAEKKKRSDLGLHIFLRNSWCPLKKKSLHFDFVSDFPIFLPKPGCSLKKKGLYSESFSEQTSAADLKLYVLFSRGAPKKRGGLRRLPHLPHLISTTEYRFFTFNLVPGQLAYQLSFLVSLFINDM